MKTWFITGASRGFGALITERALVKGDAVVATARNPQAVVDRFGAHPNLLAVALDASNEEQAAASAKAAINRFGRIDVLLNNAGFGLMGAVEEAFAAEIEAVYRTNVFGLLTVTRAVLPYMRKARTGRILNISSIGGYRAAAGFGIYSSTRFAVEGLSESLHAELEPLGIHVAVVEPGYFEDGLSGHIVAVGKPDPDRRLRGNGGQSPDGRCRPQPQPAGRSREVGGRADHIRRCAQSAGALATRKRHRCGNRSEARVGCRHPVRVALGVSLDRFPCEVMICVSCIPAAATRVTSDDGPATFLPALQLQFKLSPDRERR